MAAGGDPGRERARERPLGRAGDGRARVWRPARRRAPARRADDREGDRGAALREGPRPRVHAALGPHMLTSRELPLGPNPRTFGHGGWGGSLGFADLDARVGWAYIMNKMSPGTTGDTRAAGILAALYGSL